MISKIIYDIYLNFKELNLLNVYCDNSVSVNIKNQVENNDKRIIRFSYLMLNIADT